MRKNIDIHLNSYIWIAKLAADYMKENKKTGSIILTSSIYGLKAQDLNLYKGTEMSENLTYGVIKAGIIQGSKQMASYYGQFNIRVNTICPGGVQDKNLNKKFMSRYSIKTPLKRMAAPSDLVGVYLFLSSDLSSYITGQVLMVDGGLFNCIDCPPQLIIKKLMDKKILILVNSLDFFLTHRNTLAQKLVENGCNVEVITDMQGKNYTDQHIMFHNFEIDRASINLFSFFVKVIRLKKYLSINKYDIYYFVSHKSNILGGIATLFEFRKKIIFSITGLGYAFINRNFLAKLVKRLILLSYSNPG